MAVSRRNVERRKGSLDVTQGQKSAIVMYGLVTLEQLRRLCL